MTCRESCIVTIVYSIVSLAHFGVAAANAIADVRFDAPYRQAEYSMGDNWTPTWAEDDVLYTGSYDGAAFGGMAINAVSFGKLEASDPYHLRGVTINNMNEYREGALFERLRGLVVEGSHLRAWKM